MNNNGRWYGRALLCAALCGLAACGGSNDEETTPAAPAAVSATVGVAGGTINGPDGVQLVIPPGALSQDTTIRIARSSSGAPALPGEYPVTGSMYEITPHDLPFRQPVTLRMPVASGADTAVADVLVAAPGGDWSPAAATIANGVAELTRLSLSWYQALACGIPVPNPDPYPCSYARSSSALSTVPTGGALVRTYAANQQSMWTLGTATTLRVTTSYSAAPDCGNPRLVINRRKDNASPLAVLYDQTVPMSPISNSRSGGTVTFDLNITAADDPGFFLGTSFSCNRPGRSAQRDSYSHIVSVNVPPPAAAPSITQQPVDVAVAAGQGAAFTVAASAPDTLSITWQQSTDGGQSFSPMTAIGATLTLPATVAADNGKRFRARVCNSAPGRSDTCVESTAALLTVNSPPVAWSAPVVVATGSVEDAAAGIDGSRRSLAVWAAGNRMVASRGALSDPWSAAGEIDVGLPGGSGSFEPQLGVAPAGQATAVWGFLSGARYGIAANRFDGAAWTTAVVLDDGIGGPTDSHNVAVDGSGRAAAVWAAFNGTRYVIRVRLNTGTGWSPAVTLDRGVSAGQPQVAVDAQGRGFVTYIESGALAAATVDLAAGTVGGPVTVATARSLADHRLAVDSGGGAVLAWIEDMITGGYDLRASRFVANAWTPVETLAVDVGFNRDLAAVAGAAGTGAVAWVATDPASGRNAVFTRRFAGSWEPASRRSDAGAQRVRAVQAAMNAAGRIVLAWTQNDVTDTFAQAWGQVYDGAWGSAQPVQTSTDSLQVPGRPVIVRSLALAEDGTGLLLWRESGATTTTLFGAYLP